MWLIMETSEEQRDPEQLFGLGVERLVKWFKLIITTLSMED